MFDIKKEMVFCYASTDYKQSNIRIEFPERTEFATVECLNADYVLDVLDKEDLKIICEWEAILTISLIVLDNKYKCLELYGISGEAIMSMITGNSYFLNEDLDYLFKEFETFKVEF